jgi:hypothetical protein
MIYHLIKKDLRKLMVVVAAFFALTIVMCATVFGADYFEENEYLDASQMILAGLMLHMLVFGNLMNVEKYEEKHNAYKMMAPLPISNLEIVTAKFLNIFLSTAFGIISILVIYKLFGIGGTWPGMKLRYLLLTGALSLGLNSACYLGVFRYGFHRFRMVIMTVYVLALIGPQLVIFLQQVTERRYFLLQIAELSIPAVLGWLAAALIVFTLCLYGSVRVRESREI